MSDIVERLRKCGLVISGGSHIEQDELRALADLVEAGRNARDRPDGSIAERMELNTMWSVLARLDGEGT